MDEYRVPTVQVEAELFWADGRTLNGKLFLPEQSAVHPGRMRPAEWINQRLAFFPFRPAGGGRMVVNKQQLIAVSVGPAPDDQEEPTAVPEFPVRDVIVDAGDRSFEGRVVLDMPANQQRLVDYLNRDDAFILLRGAGRDYLVHTLHVSRVRETRGED
jgi:hypothetical protein